METKINPSSIISTAASTRTESETTSGGAPSVTISTRPSTALGIRQGASVIRDIMSLTDTETNETNTNPLPEAPRNRVVLDNTINNYRPIDTQSFTEQRPEIIAEFNFEPVYNDVSTDISPVGELLNAQIASKMLRAESVLGLLTELKEDTKTSQIIEELEKRVLAAEAEAENESKFLFELDKCLTNAKRSLTLKANENFIKDDIASRDFTSFNVEPVKDLVVNVLGFSEVGYQSFSDTKIIMQLLEDLFSIIKSYSPALITRTDPRRLADVDPFTINKYTDSTSGIINDFNISSLASAQPTDLRTLLDRNGIESFKNITRNLTNFDDRLKAFIAILSRELRVSAGLSNQTVRTTITNAFGLTAAQLDSNFFDHIIGRPGATIFDAPSIGTQSSLSRLMKVDVDQTVVLPFESSFIKRAGVTAIPGQKFYVDSIIKGQNKFDASAFTNYSSVFGTAARSLATIVEGTFDVNVVNNERLGLNGTQIFDQILNSFKVAIDEISSKPLGPLSFFTDSQPAGSRDTFTPALLSAAADDSTLSYMLTLYVTLVGIKLAHQPGAPEGIFKTLVRSGDFNAGTNQSIDSNPTAGLELEIDKLLVEVRADPMSKYGSRQAGSDDSGRLLVRSDQSSTNHSIDVLSSAIVARLLDVEASANPPRSTQPGNELYDNVSEFRVYDKLSTFGSNDPAFLLKAIVDLINKLDFSARNASYTNEKYLKDGITRFNNLGAHTIIRMIVDIYISFFKAFPIATFAGATTRVAVGTAAKEFSIKRDDSLIGELKEAFRQLNQPSGIQTTSFSNTLFIDEQTRASGARSRLIVDRFSAIKEGFEKEDSIIKKIVNVLLSVGNALSYSSNDVARFFSASGPNASYIQSLSRQPDVNVKLGALDSAQITLMRNLMLEYKVTDSSPFVAGTLIDEKTASSLFSMLRSSEFVAPVSSNLRLISIGLPAGFSESLRERTNSFTSSNDFKEFSKKAGLVNDVVKIHVYMKDLLFDDVVFKPKSFIFQLGRFVSSADFSSIESESFDDIIRVATSHVLKQDASGFNYESIENENFAMGESYQNIVSENDRTELAKNHIKSFLLSVYLKLLTGIEFTEDGFYLDDNIADLRVDQETQALFQRLIETRLSAFAGRRVTLADISEQNENVKNILTRLSDEGLLQGVLDPLGNVLQDLDKATNVELSEDITNFMKIFGFKSVLVGAGARKVKALSPKLFERILNVVVDPDDFDIDSDTTLSTESGRSFLNSQIANRLLTDRLSTSLRFNASVRKQMGNISLQQFFVVVEQLPVSSNQITVPMIIRGNVAGPKQEIRTPTINIGNQSVSRDTYESTPTTNEGVDWAVII